MHTLTKKQLTHGDFEIKIPDAWLEHLNILIAEKDWGKAKTLLPESFLQRRVVTINYKSLRNIVRQRQNHRLKEWVFFCESIKQQINHPEWL
jgi:thymidylate synthase ThyX